MYWQLFQKDAQILPDVHMFVYMDRCTVTLQNDAQISQ